MSEPIRYKETYNKDGLECPECRVIDHDASFLGHGFNSGSTKCPNCGAVIEWERHIEISYAGRVKQ